MLLPLSAPHASRLDVLAECPSTNSELIARAAGGAEDFAVLVTDTQTAGRGRLGRTWVAPPGRTLAVSVLLRPSFAQDSWGWLPLVAGLAMARAVRSVLLPASGASVAVKWPNDVLVDERKVSGLLAEIVPGGDGVVVGAGLNLTIDRQQLPTETSTSLTLEGANEAELLDRALAGYLEQLRALYSVLASGGGDARVSGIHRAVTESCATLGRRVRVTRPGSDAITATAVEIDATGRLVIERDGGAREAVAAGDVTHVRYE